MEAKPQEDKPFQLTNWRMWTNQYDCDVIFEVGKDGERIGAHKFMLMSRNEEFFKILSDLEEDAVVIPDVEPEVFRVFLKYFYTGEVKATAGNVKELCALGEKYKASILVSKCLSTLISNPAEVGSYFKQYEKIMTPDMQSRCIELIFRNPKEAFASPDFVDVPWVVLNDVVSSERLNLPEDVIYSTIVRWAENRCRKEGLPTTGENQRKKMGTLINQIRFPLVGSDFFNDHISGKNILTQNEELLLFKYFLRPGKVADDFPFITRQRKGEEAPTANADVEMVEADRNVAPVIEPGSLIQAVGVKRPKVDQINVAVQTEGGNPVSPEGAAAGGALGVRFEANRFAETRLGWSCTSTKKDAITFVSSTDAELVGVLLYTSSKRETMKIIMTVHDEELDEIRNETTLLYPDRPICEVKLKEPLPIRKDAEYHIVLAVKENVSSFYGQKPTLKITHQGGTIVTFKKSCMNTNATDVLRGQIPGVVLKV